MPHVPKSVRSAVLPLAAGLAIVAAMRIATPAAAQESALATVGDSATAWQWVQQMEEQARENPAEAARLAQRLLDGYDRKLVPAGGDDRDLFTNVRDRVQRFLLSNPSVIERYRAFESAEADRTLSAGDLAGTAALRALTAAGLRATLTLAEREVRGGRFASAEARLSEIEGHPDLRGDESPPYWFLRATCARMLGREAAARDAAGRLANLDAPVWIEGLALTEGVRPRAEAEPADPLTFSGWQQVWSDDIPGSPFARVFLEPAALNRPGNLADPTMPRPLLNRTRAGDDSPWMVMLPVVHGETVLVNNGLRLRALDRFSRRERWSRVLVDRGSFETDAGPAGDLLGVAVGDGTVVAFGGAVQGFERSGGGIVAAFDAETGAERWKIALPGLGGEEFGRLFPTGIPIVGDGQAVILARRVTPRLETVEYLLALDLADGSLRWSTFLCSSGGIRAINNRPSSTPVLADGSIFVVTGGGGVGRVDPADGRIEWFRRFLVPIRDLRQPTEPWEMGGPAIVGGSVFALSPDQSEIVQLDLRDGTTIASFPIGLAATWGSPRYLLTDGERVFAIGSDIRALDATEPDRLRWSFADENAELVGGLPGSASRSGIRGRVALVGGHLLVPTLDRMLLVSASSGRVERSIEVDQPGNPVLDSRSDAPQLFVAGVAGISCLMPADAAERAMRSRIEARPDDPQSSLALLDLAVRGRRVDLALEAARLAAAATDRASDGEAGVASRDELLDLLLVAADGCGPGSLDAGPIHDIAREVARTPEQRSRQTLAESAWLISRDRPLEAVAALRPLVEDPAFARVVLEPDAGRAVPASILAIERIQSLPPAVLAGLDAAAGPPLPGTPRDLETRLAAAANATAPTGSMRILGEAWRSLPPSPQGDADARRVVEAIRKLATAHGWSGVLAELDRTAASSRPAAGFVDSRPPATALDGPLATIVELPGRVPLRGPAEANGRPRDGFLLLEDRSISFRSGPDLALRWRRPVDDRNPVVLAWTPEAFLLWEDSTERGERASLVRRDDGSTIAQTPAARDVFPAASLIDAGRPAGQIMPNDEPYLPSDVIPLVSGDRLVVVRRSGDIAGYRLATIDRPDWVVADRLDQIYAVELLDWGLLVAGEDRSADRPEGIPTLLVLDPTSGTELSRTELPEGVRWARLGLFGEAVAGTRTGIHAVDAFSGTPLWSLGGVAGQETVEGLRLGDRLLVLDAGEGLSGVSFRDGQSDPAAFRIRETGSVGGSPVSIASAEGGVIVHRESRIQLFSPSGLGLGEDAIADDRNYTHAIPVEGGVLVLNALGGRQVPLPDRTGSRTEFPYLLYLLETSSGLRLARDPVEIRVPGQRIDRLLAIDGAMILSSGGSTVVLPIPFRSEAGASGGDSGSNPR